MPKKQRVRRLLELNEIENDNVEPVQLPVEPQPKAKHQLQQASGGRLKEAPIRNSRTNPLPNFRKKKDVHIDVNKNNIRLVL